MSSVKSINEKVAEAISMASPAILDKVVNKLATLEIERRADALLNAVSAATTVWRELQKAKPDNVSFAADGTELPGTYSKAKFEEKKKLEEKLAKIEVAVAKALEKGDFSGVLGLKAE